MACFGPSGSLRISSEPSDNPLVSSGFFFVLALLHVRPDPAETGSSQRSSWVTVWVIAARRGRDLFYYTMERGFSFGLKGLGESVAEEVGRCCLLMARGSRRARAPPLRRRGHLATPGHGRAPSVRHPGAGRAADARWRRPRASEGELSPGPDQPDLEPPPALADASGHLPSLGEPVQLEPSSIP